MTDFIHGDNSEQLLKDAEMMEAYIAITNEMGPSEQLLAFVNYDKSLESEIGLEGFDSMSLLARHEIILSKMKPDDLYELATEGLLGKLGNLIGIYKKAKEDTNTSFDKIIENDLTPKNDDANTLVPSYSTFTVTKKLFQVNHQLNVECLRAMPTTDKVDDWEKYNKYVDDVIIPKSHEAIGDGSDLFIYNEKRDGTRFKNSGWDKLKLSGAAKDAVASRDAINKTKLDLADKLTKISQMVKRLEETPEGRKTLKGIAVALTYSPKKISIWEDNVEELEKIVRKVASCFKISS